MARRIISTKPLALIYFHIYSPIPMNTNTMTLLPQSALATHASPRMSGRYGFIPTNEIVDAFSRDGWVLTKGTEAKNDTPTHTHETHQNNTQNTPTSFPPSSALPSWPMAT